MRLSSRKPLRNHRENALKRHLLLITFALIAVTICAGTLHLTSAGSASVAPTAVAQDDTIFSRGTLPVLTQGRSDVRQDVDKVLRRYDVLEFEPRAMADRVRSTGAMRLPTSTGPFDIEVAPYDMRAPHYRAEVVLDGGEVRSLERTPVRTYKGTVRGRAQAQLGGGTAGLRGRYHLSCGRPIHRGEGDHRRLLDLAGELGRGGRGVGQAVPNRPARAAAVA